MRNEKYTDDYLNKTYSGKVYGSLTVLKFSKRVKTKIYLECKCKCGIVKDVYLQGLVCGDYKSCGNHKSEIIIKRNTTHNKSNSAEYNSWSGMKTRCSNYNRSNSHRYVGRGIKVCDRWINSFENFLADMGEKPSPLHSLDRKKNEGNYEPDNCRWALKKVQANNTSKNVFITYKNETKTVTEWAKSERLSISTLARRYRNNLPIDELFSKKRIRNYKEYANQL